MNWKSNLLLLLYIGFILICRDSASREIFASNKSGTSDTVNNNTVMLNNEESDSNTDTISIIGVGDIMLGTNYPSKPDFLPPNGDCSPLLDDVRAILLDANLTFGNLEGVFADNTRTARGCRNPANCYRFSMPEKFADCLFDAGFDLLSIANNHIADMGTYGTNNTIKVLKEKGIRFAGLASCPYTTFEKDNVKYGFTAFSQNFGTNLITDIPKAKSIVRYLNSICDIVIVSFHGGAEGGSHQHVTRKPETFLGEDRGNVYKFAHALIDEGADILFGHGPHVTRAVDIYKNRFIIYSMGNFSTYQMFSVSGTSGIAPILKVFVNKRGEFIKAKITSIEQYQNNGPKIDKLNRALKRIQELTKEDLPELNITISDNGEVFNH